MSVKGHALMIAALSAIFALAAWEVLDKPSVYAGCGSGPYYVADVTAYAMGNRYSYPGGQQHEIAIGDAAAHYGRYPWGTCIYLPYEAVTIRTYNGAIVTRRCFYIWDTGYGTSDPNWVDIYFGRYKRYGQACDCYGVPSPGYCIDNAVTNSCDEAQQFGLRHLVIQPDSG